MIPVWPAIFSAVLLFIGGLLGAVLTYILTSRKEHTADWRKLKLEQYREFVLALSGIVEGRSSRAAHLRYTDAVNSMMLVAPPPVYAALQAFFEHNSTRNVADWTRDEHDRLLTALIRAMRADTSPDRGAADLQLRFGLIAPPREPAGAILSSEAVPEADEG